MKANIPTPVIVGVITVAVILVGVFLLKGASGESTAPKPDPARFLSGAGTPPGTSLPQGR
ncbi:hypothetical protein EON81_18865 [bacterium]|nr:MAG: hypothetical protein EON81_18865 [bacterium]